MISIVILVSIQSLAESETYMTDKSLSQVIQDERDIRHEGNKLDCSKLTLDVRIPLYNPHFQTGSSLRTTTKQQQKFVT
jgi:hypothetical protein